MEAIIFDLDGTLWDAVDAVVNCWNTVLRGKTTIDMVIKREGALKLFGKTMDNIVIELFPDMEQAEREALTHEFVQFENFNLDSKDCHLYDGMKNTLQTLSKTYKILLVSNCQDGYIEKFLKHSDMADCITDFTCSGKTGQPKGVNIRSIMKDNGIAKAVYVGDTQTDYEASVFAKIPMVYASYGFGAVTTPDITISKITDLLDEDVLKKMKEACEV